MTEMSQNDPVMVEYNYLSQQCGLKVSNMCLGTGTFGEDRFWPMPGQCNEALSHELLDCFQQAGGNFIDTANSYSLGQAECFVGSWLRKRQNRDNMVLITKCRFETGDIELEPNKIGLSRKHIMLNIEESLKRLQTHYTDLYMIHMWDYAVPIKETLLTLNDLVRAGKVRYVGGSNLKGWQLQKILDLNHYMGLDQFVSLQQQYNLLHRASELESFEVCQTEGLGILPWSPLCYGLLTDKVQKNQLLPADTKVATFKNNEEQGMYNVDRHLNNPKYWNLLEKLDSIARTHNRSRSQIALRWLLQKNGVTSVVFGAKSVKQLKSNLEAAKGWTLTEQQMQELDEVTCPHMEDPYSTILEFNSDRMRQLLPQY